MAASGIMQHECDTANWVCKVVINPNDGNDSQEVYEFSVEAFVACIQTVHDNPADKDDPSHLSLALGFFFGERDHVGCSVRLPETEIFTVEVTIYHRVQPTVDRAGHTHKGDFVNVANVVFSNSFNTPALYGRESEQEPEFEFLQADSEELKLHMTLGIKRHNGRVHRNVTAVTFVISEQMLRRVVAAMVASKRVTSLDRLPEACRAILDNDARLPPPDESCDKGFNYL